MANLHVFKQVPLPGGPGGGTDGGGGECLPSSGLPGGRGGEDAQLPATLGPQSAQSEQAVHDAYSEPLPPSSQSPSDSNEHVLIHTCLEGEGD